MRRPKWLHNLCKGGDSWKNAFEHIDCNSLEEISEKTIDEFRERIEILFTWGHKLAGVERIPGTGAECPSGKNGVPLTFESWKRTFENTSLLAAVTYGPSLKFGYGLGFLEPTRRRVFRVCGEGISLAKALDQSLRTSSAYDLMESFNAFLGDKEMALSLLPLWKADEPTSDERDAFRRALYIESDASGRAFCRSCTIKLIRTVLRGSNSPLTIKEIRHRMAFGSNSGGTEGFVDGDLKRARFQWAMLQARQGQRLALESIQSWMERLLVESGRAWRYEAILDEAISQLSEKSGVNFDNMTVGDLRSLIGEEKSDNEQFGSTFQCSESPVELADSLEKGIRMGGTSLYESLCLLVKSVDLASGIMSMEDSTWGFRQGGAQRVSLSVTHDLFEEYKGRRVEEFLDLLLGRLVLSQHFATAVGRFEGRTQRLRLTVEEEGIVSLIDKVWRPQLTPDRLESVLWLMSQCELAQRDSQTGCFQSVE